MKESAFRLAVLRHLPAGLHTQGMPAGVFGTAGTPDTYLDYKYDLWCEWKIIRREDHLPAAIPPESLPTALQRKWLDRRWHAGGNAVCLVGFKLRGRAHGIVLDTPALWSTAPTREEYEPKLLSANALADYLLRRVS